MKITDSGCHGQGLAVAEHDAAQRQASIGDRSLLEPRVLYPVLKADDMGAV